MGVGRADPLPPPRQGDCLQELQEGQSAEGAATTAAQRSLGSHPVLPVHARPLLPRLLLRSNAHSTAFTLPGPAALALQTLAAAAPKAPARPTCMHAYLKYWLHKGLHSSRATAVMMTTHSGEASEAGRTLLSPAGPALQQQASRETLRRRGGGHTTTAVQEQRPARPAGSRAPAASSPSVSCM